jgi:protein CpxP
MNEFMKTAKYLIMAAVIAGGLLVLGLPGQAAEKAGKSERRARADAAKDRLQQISKELNLTPEQKEKVKPILQAEREKLRGLRDLAPDQRREKAKEIRKEMGDKLKAILTPEQLEKWQKMRQQRLGKRGEKKTEHK